MPRLLHKLVLALTAFSVVSCGVSQQVPLFNSRPVIPQANFETFDANQTAAWEKLESHTDSQGLIDDTQIPKVDFQFSPPPGDLANFGEVAPGIFRGARPTEKGIQMLKDKGVKLIIQLENFKGVVQKEKEWAEKAGIQFVNIPMSVITPPSSAKVQQFLKLVQDPANKPVYFHCMQGRDRTGSMAFVYRISVDGWNYEKSYEEMKRYGFHRYLLGLKFFVWNYARKYAKQELTPTVQTQRAF